MKGDSNKNSRRVWGERKTNYYNLEYHLWFSKTEHNKRHRKDCFSMSFNILLPPILVRNKKFMKARQKRPKWKSLGGQPSVENLYGSSL